MSNCPKCNAQYAEGKRFYGECGTPFSVVPTCDSKSPGYAWLQLPKDNGGWRPRLPWRVTAPHLG